MKSQPLAKSLSAPWRIEGRPTPFAPWVVLEHCGHLEAAVKKLPALKQAGRFYAMRVRAN